MTVTLFLLQSVIPPTGDSISGYLLYLLAVLFLARPALASLASRIGVGLSNFFQTIIDERRAKTNTLEQANEQIRDMYKQLKILTDSFQEAAKTNVEVLHSFNEQSQQIAQERLFWQGEMARVMEDNKAAKSAEEQAKEAFAQMAIENHSLKTENTRLTTEVEELKQRLSQYESGNIPIPVSADLTISVGNKSA